MKGTKTVLLPRLTGILEEMGENIKLARLRRKQTAEQIAERAGISRSRLKNCKQLVNKSATNNTFMVLLLIVVCCTDSSRQKHPRVMQEEVLAIKETTVLPFDYPEYKGDVKISDIADSIFYVSLKHGNTDVLQLYYFDSLIFLNDINYVYIFDMEGHVKNKILLQMGSFDVSPDRQKIYTYQFQTRVISSYDFEGNNIWQTKIKYPNPKDELGNYGYSFLSINDTLFAISNINFGSNKDKLIFVDQHGHVVHSAINDERFTPPNSVYSTNRGWHRSLFRDEEQIYYHSPHSDTLFSIDAKTLIQTPIVVEQKLPKVPLRKRLEYTGEKVSDFHNYCTNVYVCKEDYQDIWTDSSKYVSRFFDTSRYTVISYTHGSLMLPTSNFLIYDKKTGVLSRTKNDISKSMTTKFLHFGLFNNYDGGLSFEPEHQSGDYLIMVNAGISQGGMKRFPKELYLEGRKIADDHYVCKSNSYLKLQYKDVLNDFFFNEVDSKNNTVLSIIKMKTK